MQPPSLQSRDSFLAGEKSTKSVRSSRFFSSLWIGSHVEAEKLIELGWVTSFGVTCRARPAEAKSKSARELDHYKRTATKAVDVRSLRLRTNSRGTRLKSSTRERGHGKEKDGKGGDGENHVEVTVG
jgi:hypothetical protein